MTPARLVRRSLRHYWAINLVTLAGLALAGAVVVGSLVIGDSVTGSLRDRALARLGRTDWALQAPAGLRAGLAEELVGPAQAAAALLTTSGGVRVQADGEAVHQAQVLGVEEDFWALYPDQETLALSDRQAALSAALAEDLGVEAGEYLLVSAQRPAEQSPDILFAPRGREAALRSLRVQVARVLPERGPGGFSLAATPQAPRNLFLSRAWLAEQLELPSDEANLILLAAPDAQADSLREARAERLSLRDYGLRLHTEPQRDRLRLEARGLTLTQGQIEAAQQAAEQVGAQARQVSVYLATTLRRAGAEPGAELAYALVAAAQPPLDLPALEGQTQPGEQEVLLNEWAAADLGAAVGELLELQYLAPQPDGSYVTLRIPLTLAGIVALRGPGRDPGLTPEFPGITDAADLRGWTPPFPVDLDRVTERDETYWDLHRATPKAYVAPSALRDMWAGLAERPAQWITGVHVTPGAGGSPAQIEPAFRAALQSRLAEAGEGPALLPVREQALEAARGSTDLGQLMLGMSLFLMAAGVWLAAMLTRLAAQRRAGQIGLMQAVGCPPQLGSRVLGAEGAALSLLAALLGAPLGVGYAAAVLAGLTGPWAGAVADTPLSLHVQPGSVAAGAAATLLLGLLATGLALRGLARREALELLAGRRGRPLEAGSDGPQERRSRRWRAAALALLAAGAAALVALGAAQLLSPTAAFFGAGAALVAALPLAARLLLGRLLPGREATGSLPRLALRSAAAYPGRAVLTVGLMGAAAFVLVAVAANARHHGTLDPTRRDSGTGGYSLRATVAVPLPHDPSTPTGRENLGFLPPEEEALQDTEIVGLLVSPGEDISCLNLARPTTARLLGVGDRFLERGGFRVRTRGPAPDNPWELLREPDPEPGVLPAFGDAASVQWTLHTGLGEIYETQGPDGEPLRLRIVGLLMDSLFQSELLIAEEPFRELYPQVTRPAHFLVQTPADQQEQVAEVFRAALGELGVEVRSTRELLDSYLRVQNTYLSMFLALGGLGLLLGTVGLGTVLVRSALERRGELALLLAAGFTRGRLTALLVAEHLALPLAGVAGGTLAGLVAVGPQLLSAQAQPNWRALATVLAAVLVTGALTGVAAARAVVRGELISALREE